jgi:hypothetical protein
MERTHCPQRDAAFTSDQDDEPVLKIEDCLRLAAASF